MSKNKAKWAAFGWAFCIATGAVVQAQPWPDFDGNGTVGFSDFLLFAEKFGKDVPAPAVSIPDANLRAEIERQLGKSSGTPITAAEMQLLTTLYLIGKHHQRFDRAGARQQPDRPEAFGKHHQRHLPACGHDQPDKLVAWAKHHQRHLPPCRTEQPDNPGSSHKSAKRHVDNGIRSRST